MMRTIAEFVRARATDDGENIASAQIEEILFRHADVVLAGGYAVPDPAVGDRVMAAQPDLGTKRVPDFVRVTQHMPVTATTKVLRRQLRQERWRTTDAVWWKPRRGSPYRRLDAADLIAWEALFAPGALQRL